MKSDLGMPWTIVFACLHLLFCRKYSIYIVEVGRWGRIGRTVRIMGRMRLRAMMTGVMMTGVMMTGAMMTGMIVMVVMGHTIVGPKKT